MRKESYGSVRVFWLESEEVRRRLREAARELVEERSEVRAVHLFGSLAEDRAVPGSDADLLIVLERSDRLWMDRPLEYESFFRGVGMPVELFCYTAEELERVELARRALETGTRLAGAEQAPPYAGSAVR